VSSLKAGHPNPPSDQINNHGGLGLVHATLRWNAVSESTKESEGTPIGKAVPKQKKRIRTPSSPDDDASTAVADSSDESGSEEGDHSFRLRDISVSFSFRLRDVSVLFAEGALTMVTGPTASRKTALLVWCLDFFFLYIL